MAYRVAAIFDDRDTAERAADALVESGADRNQISLLARGEEGAVTTTAPAVERHEDRDFVEPAREVGDSGAPLTTTDKEDAAQGAATGAAVGAVAGVTAGVLSLMVPGFGLITAAGPLAWALGGAAATTAAGAITGGVVGALKDIGIDEKHGRVYEERIRGGDVLMTAVILRLPEDQVLELLTEHGAEDVSFAEMAPGAIPAAAAPAASAYGAENETSTRTVDYRVETDDAPTIARPTVDPEARVSPAPGWDADRQTIEAGRMETERGPRRRPGR